MSPPTCAWTCFIPVIVKKWKKRDDLCINKTTTIVVSFSIWPLGFYLFIYFSGGSLFVMAPLINVTLLVDGYIYVHYRHERADYVYQAIAKTSAALCFSHFFNRVPGISISSEVQWRAMTYLYARPSLLWMCVRTVYPGNGFPTPFPCRHFKNMTILRGAFCSRAYLPYHVCVYIAISLKVAHIIYDTIHNMNAAATV